MPEGEPITETPASTPEVKTFTQDEVNRIVEDRLKRERSKFSDYDELKSKAAEADSSKSELQKITERLENAERKQAEADARALKAEVAQAKGLTAAQARRLQGSTREELESDADDLLETFGGKKETTPESGGTETGGSDGSGGQTGSQESGKPKPDVKDLREGSGAAKGEDFDPKKVADEIFGVT